MKKIKKDIRGMTLIEVVVSLLIVSTASLIMVQRFVTVNRLFYEANQYNETTNDVRASLVANDSGKVTSTSKVNVINESTTGNSIIIKDISIKGNYFAATSKVFNDNQLRTFSSTISLKTIAPEEPSENVGSDLYSSYCAMMEDLGDYLKKEIPECFNSNYSLDSKEVKKALGKYVRQEKFGTSNEQLKKLNLTDSINLTNKLGEIYIAHYFRGNTVFPSITRNSAVKMAKWNKDIFPNYQDASAKYPVEKEDYCYPTLLPSFDQNISLVDLFENKVYKDKIFIVLYNHPDVKTPNKVVAVYKNNNKKDLDAWFVYNGKDDLSIENLTDLNDYDAFAGSGFPSIGGTSWWEYEVVK